MRLKTLSAEYGETLKVSTQWAAEAEKRGTTVSTSAWTYTGDGDLSGAALDSTLASTLLAIRSCGTLVNTAMLANGETLIACRNVLVNSAPPMDYQ